MDTLALVLFVALALLTTMRGRESATRESVPAKAAKSEVVIDNLSFSPKTFTASTGATVTWTNYDNVPQLVTGADNQFQKSPGFKAGRIFSNIFATAGTDSYFCSIHPRMTGKDQLSAED